MSLPIFTVNRGNGNAAVIDLSDIFLTEFAQLGLGALDRLPHELAPGEGVPE